MRILVVSDSHRSRSALDSVPSLCREERIDRIFHLGDMADDAEELALTCGVPVSSVPGNCDLFSFGMPQEVWESVAGGEYILTHGHRYGVKGGLSALAAHVRQAGAKGAFFGHTHVPYFGTDGGIVLINPGSLREGSYCVVEADGSGLRPVFGDLRRGPRGD